MSNEKKSQMTKKENGKEKSQMKKKMGKKQILQPEENFE